MSTLISAEIAATCNALGYFDAKEDRYYTDANTLETAKDLIRYLRRDDESFDVRRQLGATKVLQTDLLPLLKSYWEENELFDVVLRLLVNLTTPALILWEEEIPIEKKTRNHYLEIEDHLRGYKEAFADVELWSAVSKRMSKILEVDFSQRGEENSLVVERALILIRNVLYVPSNPDEERRPDNDASVHDQVLWALHQSSILDIILYVSGSVTEQAYSMHILETLSFMLREQNASELAKAAPQRSQSEKDRDQAELIAIRERENAAKQQKVRAFAGTRHSRFGGTYVVTSIKGIGDNDLIYHKPLSKLDDLNFDAEKQSVRTPKNRIPMQSVSTERRSAFSIRLFLKEFCVEFLKAAYNTLMRAAKRAVVRQITQAHDESYYLWAMRFFMEFNRGLDKFEVKLVSETMSVSTFHFVQSQSEKYFDMVNVDKKKIRLWSRRLHLSLLAYKELLMTLGAMDKSEDYDVKQSSKVIKSNIFYVLEYRELVLTLLFTYDELKMSDAYLTDLMETQHVFLKMLQSYCTSSDLVVQAKGKRKKRKPGNKKKSQPPLAVDPCAEWDEIAPQLSVVLEGAAGVPGDVVPFDAASDVPVDDQKSETMKNIQSKLKNGDFEEAVGLMRAAREVWPENDSFGSPNIAPEEEFLALKDIFHANLGVEIPSVPQYEEEENEEEDEIEESIRVSESDFKFDEFAKRLANPKVIRACGLVLKKFEKNSPLTNHCVVKLLHRIAWDCKISTMVFQVSIFRTFQKIYEFKYLPQYKELVKFANYIVGEFIKVVGENPKVYVEALFWKNSKDAYDIEYGYGASKEQSEAASKAWTEHEEDELRVLFMEHKNKEIQEDPVDWILANLIKNASRTRRAVLLKLKELHLLTDYKSSRAKSSSTRAPKQWTEEEEAQLRELYESFRAAADPVGCIIDRLDVKRPKNRVVEKILELGLVTDRKELRKKRSKKNKSEGVSDKSSSESDSEIIPNKSDAIRTSKPKPKKKSRPKNATSVPYGSVLRLLSTLRTLNMTDALDWLRECFEDVANDLDGDEDDDGEGIPLVPILDCAVSAMENPTFLDLIKAFGVQEPTDQEVYWRIPSGLNDNIRRFLGEEIPVESEQVTIPIVISEGENEDDGVNKRKKKSRIIISSDDDDEDVSCANIHEVMMKVLDSDEGGVEEVESSSKRLRLSDSEPEIPNRKRSRVIIDSDDDE